MARFWSEWAGLFLGFFEAFFFRSIEALSCSTRSAEVVPVGFLVGSEGVFTVFFVVFGDFDCDFFAIETDTLLTYYIYYSIVGEAEQDKKNLSVDQRGLGNILLERPEFFPLFQVENNAEGNPDNQHQIALRSKAHAGETRNGDELENHEDAGENCSGNGHNLQRRSAIVVTFHNSQSSNAGGEVAD